MEQNNQQDNYYNPQPQMTAQPVTEEKASVGLAILSFLIPLAGLIIFLVNRDKRPKTAKTSGICALVSFLISFLFGIISMMTIFKGATLNDFKDASSYYNQEGQIIDGTTLGDYDCVIKNAELTKNSEAVITLDFTNNSNEAIPFYLALNIHAYQNGEMLETAVSDEESQLNEDVEIGDTKEIKITYTLNDTTTPIDVEVEKALEYNGDKIVKTLNIN